MILPMLSSEASNTKLPFHILRLDQEH